MKEILPQLLQRYTIDQPKRTVVSALTCAISRMPILWLGRFTVIDQYIGSVSPDLSIIDIFICGHRTFRIT